jgi:hypothetical protein
LGVADEYFFKIFENNINSDFLNNTSAKLLKAERTITIKCFKKDNIYKADWYMDDNFIVKNDSLIITIKNETKEKLFIKADKLGIANNKYANLIIELVDFNTEEEILKALKAVKTTYSDTLTTKRTDFSNLLEPLNTYIITNKYDRFLITGVNDEYATEGMSNYFINVKEKKDYANQLDTIIYNLISKDKEVLYHAGIIKKIDKLTENKATESHELWSSFVQIITVDFEKPENPFNFNFEEYQDSLYKQVNNKLINFIIPE